MRALPAASSPAPLPRPPAPARVWVVEDDADYREALLLVLNHERGVVPGRAYGRAEALGPALAGCPPDERPDVLLLDVNLPGQSGLDLVAELAVRAPYLRVVMLTVRDDRPTMEAAIRAGASGYVPKSAPLDVLLGAVIEARRGGLVVPPELAGAFREAFQTRAPFPEAEARRRFGLTAQEARVAALLAERLSNREIAERLSVSPHTVRHHAERVLNKLGVVRRGEVADALRPKGEA